MSINNFCCEHSFQDGRVSTDIEALMSVSSTGIPFEKSSVAWSVHLHVVLLQVWPVPVVIWVEEKDVSVFISNTYDQRERIVEVM